MVCKSWWELNTIWDAWIWAKLSDVRKCWCGYCWRCLPCPKDNVITWKVCWVKNSFLNQLNQRLPIQRQGQCFLAQVSCTVSVWSRELLTGEPLPPCKIKWAGEWYLVLVRGTMPEKSLSTILEVILGALNYRVWGTVHVRDGHTCVGGWRGCGTWPSAVFWFLELVCSDVRASGRETATGYCCNLLFKSCMQLWSRAIWRHHHSGLILAWNITAENKVRR